MNLIIRADANSRIGTGHLMRSLALAQSWQANGGKVTFITNCESAELRERFKNEGFAVVEIEKSYPHSSDIAATQKVLANHSSAWCVIDGYHFDAAFHGQIRQSGNRVLVVDDTAHLPFYDADAILNQNINAAGLIYNCPKDTILFSGTGYALLRSEFLTWKDWKRNIPVVARKILITMGGSDFHNQTLKAIRAVEQLEIENLAVKAVVGANNSHFAELRQIVKHSHAAVELIKNAENIPELMVWADAAISAAGSTCWEMAFLRLPSVLLVTAENQTGIAEGLDKKGFAENLGWFEEISETNLAQSLRKILLDKARRGVMCETGRDIIDGQGASRVVEFLSKNI